MNRLEQFVHIDRFGDVPVHSGREGGGFVFLIGICGNCYDRDVTFYCQDGIAGSKLYTVLHSFMIWYMVSIICLIVTCLKLIS